MEETYSSKSFISIRNTAVCRNTEDCLLDTYAQERLGLHSFSIPVIFILWVACRKWSLLQNMNTAIYKITGFTQTLK
jgi:hypothetical protein